MNTFSLLLQRPLLGLGCLLALLSTVTASQARAANAAVANSGIEIGLQCWTFRSFTLQQTLDKAQALGIHNLQAYPGQLLGGGLEGKFDPSLSLENIRKVQAWLKERDLAIVSYGVTTPKDEAEWKALVVFAKAFGIQTITTEPPQTDLPMIDKVTRGSGLRIALHNHPIPSRYADPAVALAAIKDLDKRFGLCADTGHWTRNAMDPVAGLRLAAGRIIEVHFKDISEPAKVGHDMPWGTGIGQASRQLAELRSQGFKGILFMEYEHNTGRLEANVALCIAWFRSALRASPETLVSGAVVPPGFSADVTALWRDRGLSSPGRWESPTPLFKADLSNAAFAPGSWAWEGDVLVAKGGGDLWTKESYGNFALSLEFLCAEKSNSGVFLRTSDIVNWLNNAIEVQILQGDAENPRHVVGSLFDVQPPIRQLPIEPGTWHRYVIIAKGSAIRVILDGEEVLKADLNQWTKAGFNPDGSPNKFTKAYADMAREGRIGLQYHGSPISFRNILIEKL
jgi:sugar phosphate isomerase/epimerase